MIVDLILGLTLGTGLGISAFVAVMLVITFVGSYVFERVIPWQTKAYLFTFIVTCYMLMVAASFTLIEIYEPNSWEDAESMLLSVWRSHYSGRALMIFSFVTFAGCMVLFLVGPIAVVQHIRVRVDPRINRENPVIGEMVETDIPARLDRLPWGAFHTLIALALGVTWILNGLEVTLAGSLTTALFKSPILQFSSPPQVEIAHGAYLAGAVVGALFFGWLTDRLGRKKLFFITLLLYLVSTALTGLSWSFESLALFRFLTGTGIGGEYAAINSTIQELIPARFRGRTDLLISGTFWVGAAIGALGSTVLLDPNIIDPENGWRIAFLIGAGLALLVLVIRPAIPESPRWLMTHGRLEEAEAIVASIERRYLDQLDAAEQLSRVRLKTRQRTPFFDVVRTIFQVYPMRAFVCFSLMAAQAMVYNSIFFNHALVLNRLGVADDMIGWYFLPFAAGNFFGPLILGPLFDTIGRRRMIGITYLASGAFLGLIACLLAMGGVAAMTMSLVWMVTFFFASAAASAAYLTAGELFPLEIRALAIAFFYSIGTGVVVMSPWLFARLTTGPEAVPYMGYVVLAVVMLAAAIAELLFGIDAERKPLESVAQPLTFVR